MSESAELWRFPLHAGASKSPANGACLLDAVSWLEYGHLGDSPECVCPVIATYGRGINDRLGRLRRQDLRPFIPRLVGTVDPAAEEPRAVALLRHAARVVLPSALDARNPALAVHMRTLKQDITFTDLQAVMAGALGDPALALASVTEREAEVTPATAAGFLGREFFDAVLEVVPLRDHDRRDAVQRAMIEGLEVMLRLGRQAGPVDGHRWTAALDSFERTRERAA